MRLIDADALEITEEYEWVEDEDGLEDEIYWRYYAEETIEDAPTFELVRCRDCKHFHENVWGNDIGLNDWPIIVAHEACDAWGKEWTQSCADGYCHMAERRTDDTD